MDSHVRYGHDESSKQGTHLTWDIKLVTHTANNMYHAFHTSHACDTHTPTHQPHPIIVMVPILVPRFIEGEGSVVPTGKASRSNEKLAQRRVNVKEEGPIQIPACMLTKVCFIPAAGRSKSHTHTARVSTYLPI